MRFLLPAAFCFVSLTCLRADLVVVQDVDTMGQHLTMTLKTKGAMTRVDVNPQMSIIMDATTGDMKTLMHDQKMFMSMNMESMKGMIEAMSKSKSSNDTAKPEIKAMGNKEKINGYDTEEYLFTQGANVSHVWIAKDFPHFDAFLKSMETMKNGPIGKMSPQMQMDMSQLPGMPIKTIVEVNGKPSATMVVKSVDEKDLPATDFTPPADYTTFSMPTIPPPNAATAP